MPPIHRPIPVRATLMRGGTSKGLFIALDDLPAPVRDDPARRDALLLRAIGSPDPYGKQIDGLGGATSSTSKVVLVRRSARPDCDVDYWFGAVAIGQPVIDWSGNCGNLTAAVGPFAIARGWLDVPADGIARVHLWQANLGKRIVAHVPMCGGEVQELGDFRLDGVAFPAAEIRLDFLDPGADGALFPTGQRIDRLDVPGVGALDATLINAGNPTIFVDAAALGLRGTELQADVNTDPALLARCEAVRAHAAVVMGLAGSAAEASEKRPHTPKLAVVAKPASYTASSGVPVDAAGLDLNARIVSMGLLHHAMTGTGAVALAAAAAIPGTVVARLFGPDGRREQVCFGHPSGTLRVGVRATAGAAGWRIDQVTLSRSARRLMDGVVFVPATATD